MKIFFLKGLPASGKTTWAMEKVSSSNGNIKRVNKDSIREMLSGQWFGGKSEQLVLDIRDTAIHSALGRGLDVIVDDTNFNPKHHQRINEIASIYGAEVEEIFFDISVDECIKRDRKRSNPVGSKVIRRMYNQYLRVKNETKPEENNLLPMAIICDIDGTVALMNGRSPYDPSLYETDLVNMPIFRLLCKIGSTDATTGYGWKILFVSGREDKYREQTLRWLDKANIVFDSELFMRSTGDNRKDYLIKKEIYENNIKGKYNVVFVLDDRDQVVDMWRNELGLTCLQVAEGDF